MEPIKEIVKDPQWQEVRKSLLNSWMSRPDWCCLQLRKYLGSISKASVTKLRIVFNYVTGTGFRIGAISHQCITKLKAEISMEIKKRKAKDQWN